MLVCISRAQHDFFAGEGFLERRGRGAGGLVPNRGCLLEWMNVWVVGSLLTILWYDWHNAQHVGMYFAAA